MILSKIQAYFIALLLVIIAANAGYSVYVSGQRDDAYQDRDIAKKSQEAAETEASSARAETLTVRKALKATQAELSAARAAIHAREIEIEQILKNKEASDAQLQRALNGSRDWSDTVVPDSVRDAIGKAQ